MLFPSSPALAATYSWAFGASGTTNTTVNWSPVGVPGANDDTHYFQNATYNVTVLAGGDTAKTVWTSNAGHAAFFGSPLRIRNSFTVDGNAATTIGGGFVRAGWFTVGPGSLTITGNGTQAASTNINATDYIGAAGGFTSTLSVTGGASFSSHVLYVPEFPDATGILVVAGHPFQGGPSTVHVVFEGGSSQFTGQFVVGNQGTGDVELSNGGFINVDAELWIGTNGFGKFHMFHTGLFPSPPSLYVNLNGHIGHNLNVLAGGQGLLAVDQGTATFHQALIMGDDDGGQNDSLRMTGGTVIVQQGLVMNANNTGTVDMRGGLLHMYGSDDFLGNPYYYSLINQTGPLTMSGAGNPTVTFEHGSGHQLNTVSPLSLALGRGSAGTLQVLSGGDFLAPAILTVSGGALIADSLAGTGTLIADYAGRVSLGGTLTIGPGNGIARARHAGGIISTGEADVLASATTGGSLLIEDPNSFANFNGGLELGGTSVAASPGPGIATVDSSASIYVQHGLRVWKGGGRLYAGVATSVLSDSVLCSGEMQLANGTVTLGYGAPSAALHLFDTGTLHGVGNILGRVQLDDLTALLEILATDLPNDTLVVGDSTLTDAFTSNGTVRVEQDTLVIMNHGGVNLGHIVLAGGTLRLPQGGHVRVGDVLEGCGRLEGSVLDDGLVHLITGATPSLDLAGHLTCLTGQITGSTLNVLAGSELTLRGSSASVVRLGGTLDMGPTPASLTMQTALTIMSSGILTMRIGSKASGVQDALTLGHTTAMAGTLDLRSWTADPPAVGDTLTLITGPSITGTFASVTIDGLIAPGIVQLIYSPTSVKVAILHSTTGVNPDPNPAPTVTALRFAALSGARDASFALDLPDAADVRIALYDVSGRQLAALDAGTLAPGRHRLSLGATGLPSAVYFGRAQVADRAGTHVLTTRLVRLQ